MREFIKGFTLAEVLITLLIIGVISSLVIPALISQTNNAEIATKVIKYQSVLQQAVMNYKTQNTYSSLTDSPLSSDFDNVNGWNSFKTQLNLVKDCGTAIGFDCFANVTYKRLNGTDEGNYNNYAIVGRGILQDGSSIGYEAKSYCSTNRSINNSGPLYNSNCAFVYIDVNGFKPPNKVGRDVFGWYIMRNGMVYSMGSLDDTYSGCDPSSSDIAAGTDGAPGSGLGCTAKVLQEGKISY